MSGIECSNCKVKKSDCALRLPVNKHLCAECVDELRGQRVAENSKPASRTTSTVAMTTLVTATIDETAAPIVSELLYYVFNQRHIMKQDDIKRSILSFYNDSEIASACEQLFSDIEKAGFLNSEQLKCVRKHKNAKKSETMVAGILTMLYESYVIAAPLPRYVSADMSRVPPLRSGDFDFCSLIADMKMLKEEMGVMKARVALVEQSPPPVDNEYPPVWLARQRTANDQRKTFREALNTVPRHVQKAHLSENSAGTVQNQRLDGPGGAGGRRTVALAAAGLGTRPKSAALPRPRPALQGKRQTSCKLAVAAAQDKRTPFSLFVTRLGPDMKENDIIDFVREETGVTVQCEKLETKHSGYTSFKVTTLFTHKDQVMSENLWPPEVLFRQWFGRENTYRNGTNVARNENGIAADSSQELFSISQNG